VNELLLLLGLALAVSVVFSVWRISANVKKIREHFDRVDALYAAARGERAP